MFFSYIETILGTLHWFEISPASYNFSKKKENDGKYTPFFVKQEIFKHKKCDCDTFLTLKIYSGLVGSIRLIESITNQNETILNY